MFKVGNWETGIDTGGPEPVRLAGTLALPETGMGGNGKR